jgi:hypothetical protein
MNLNFLLPFRKACPESVEGRDTGGFAPVTLRERPVHRSFSVGGSDRENLSPSARLGTVERSPLPSGAPKSHFLSSPALVYS